MRGNYGDDDGPAPTVGVLPKALLGGKSLRPGDTLTLQVDSVHADEVVVCVPKAKKKAEEPPEAPTEEETAEPVEPGEGAGNY